MTLELQGVTYRYARTDTPALDGVSLAIPAGRTTAVLGLSGSGKTTLLNLLGLLWEGSPERGTVCYRNGTATYPYARLSRRQAARLRLENFGFVLQSSYLLPHFTCGQNIAVPLALKGEPPAARARKVDALLEKADPDGRLARLRDRSAREVSGGERQRVGLLRAIAHDPNVVFADEPVSNLDFHNAGLVLHLLQEWKAGRLHPDSADKPRTLVLVSHSIELAHDLADHFVLLKLGGLVDEHGKVPGRVLARTDLPGGPRQIYDAIKLDKGR